MYIPGLSGMCEQRRGSTVGGNWQAIAAAAVLPKVSAAGARKSKN